MKNNQWKALFRFSKRERAGLLVLLCCFAVILVLPRFYNGVTPVLQIDTAAEQQLLSSATTVGTTDTAAVLPAQLFRFDPNTLPAQGWQQLGLKPRTIQTILHYRGKGGLFKKPQDLLKLYGLSPAAAARLMPFVSIDTTLFHTAWHNNGNTRFAQPQPVDVNTADTAQWAALPGIGPVLAARIVQQREAQGGFVSIEQVGQVYGVADSLYKHLQPWLRLQTPGTGKTNINTATLAQLKSNPHLPPDVAAAILLYRQQHGPYRQVTDVQQIVFINAALFQKIAPYITTGK
ncbi:helix-hairpin-helix domain-containing protein [Deminuibacter soli]|uniref:Helix-hairpin-helix domain-containing protein n=1 Tax=Deminuibacter soli TaxID=2291815 RepID=A0A3E1NPC5_9BACT|nr:helix-hairpin-helix domain-containing protein [Deminuibacter soli]RFM29786.1 hypothetical protein DXN05_02065 [Deminuibacter soli]